MFCSVGVPAMNCLPQMTKKLSCDHWDLCAAVCHSVLYLMLLDCCLRKKAKHHMGNIPLIYNLGSLAGILYSMCTDTVGERGNWRGEDER